MTGALDVLISSKISLCGNCWVVCTYLCWLRLKIVIWSAQSCSGGDWQLGYGISVPVMTEIDSRGMTYIHSDGDNRTILAWLSIHSCGGGN